MHKLNVWVERTQRFIVLLPLAVHPDQERWERLNQSALEHLSYEARFSTASWTRYLYGTWVTKA